MSVKGFNTMHNYRSYSNRYINNDMDNSKHACTAKDYGPNPFVINIEKATLQNNYFRTALWTGDYLQLTLMSIKPGKDIGFEVHPDLDQFLRIEQGQGVII